MARFTYQAQTNTGHSICGTLQAGDRDSAMQILSEKYQLVTELQEVKSRRPLLGFLRRRPSTEQMLGFFQQMAIATGAGIPIKSTLDSMAEDCDHPVLQAALIQLSADLSAGANLSQAMAAHPGIFSSYQPRLVKAGEASGKMSDVLGQLALDLEGREHLTGQVRSALAYPAFVLGVACILTLAMLAWGVPQVKQVFDGMNAELPLPTQILVDMGLSLSNYWWLWLVGLVGMIFALPKAVANPKFRLRLENFLLNTWPFGSVFRQLNVSIFSRTLGLLYRSGVPLSTAMEIVAETTTSQSMTAVVNTLRTRVTHGETLSSAMRGTGYFPSMAVEMVSTGEKAGSLDRMLQELDHFYARRCEMSIKSLTSLLEPALTVVVGILLGGVILGLALPFLSMPSLMM